MLLLTATLGYYYKMSTGQVSFRRYKADCSTIASALCYVNATTANPKELTTTPALATTIAEGEGITQESSATAVSTHTGNMYVK